MSNIWHQYDTDTLGYIPFFSKLPHVSICQCPCTNEQHREEKRGEIGYLDFSGDVDSAEFAFPEWLSDLKVVDGPFPIHFLRIWICLKQSRNREAERRRTAIQRAWLGRTLTFSGIWIFEYCLWGKHIKSKDSNKLLIFFFQGIINY